MNSLNDKNEDSLMGESSSDRNGPAENDPAESPETMSPGATSRINIAGTIGGTTGGTMPMDSSVDQLGKEVGNEQQERFRRELGIFLSELNLSHYYSKALQWVEVMGASFLEEVLDEQTNFSRDLGMKPLESKRLSSERAKAAKCLAQSGITTNDDFIGNSLMMNSSIDDESAAPNSQSVSPIASKGGDVFTIGKNGEKPSKNSISSNFSSVSPDKNSGLVNNSGQSGAPLTSGSQQIPINVKPNVSSTSGAFNNLNLNSSSTILNRESVPSGFYNTERWNVSQGGSSSMKIDPITSTTTAGFSAVAGSSQPNSLHFENRHRLLELQRPTTSEDDEEQEGKALSATIDSDKSMGQNHAQSDPQEESLDMMSNNIQGNYPDRGNSDPSQASSRTTYTDAFGTVYYAGDIYDAAMKQRSQEEDIISLGVGDNQYLGVRESQDGIDVNERLGDKLQELSIEDDQMGVSLDNRNKIDIDDTVINHRRDNSYRDGDIAINKGIDDEVVDELCKEISDHDVLEGEDDAVLMIRNEVMRTEILQKRKRETVRMSIVNGDLLNLSRVKSNKLILSNDSSHTIGIPSIGKQSLVVSPNSNKSDNSGKGGENMLMMEATRESSSEEHDDQDKFDANAFSENLKKQGSQSLTQLNTTGDERNNWLYESYGRDGKVNEISSRINMVYESYTAPKDEQDQQDEDEQEHESNTSFTTNPNTISVQKRGLSVQKTATIQTENDSGRNLSEKETGGNPSEKNHGGTSSLSSSLMNNAAMMSMSELSPKKSGGGTVSFASSTTGVRNVGKAPPQKTLGSSLKYMAIEQLLNLGDSKKNKESRMGRCTTNKSTLDKATKLEKLRSEETSNSTPKAEDSRNSMERIDENDDAEKKFTDKNTEILFGSLDGTGHSGPPNLVKRPGPYTSKYSSDERLRTYANIPQHLLWNPEPNYAVLHSDPPRGTPERVKTGWARGASYKGPGAIRYKEINNSNGTSSASNGVSSGDTPVKVPSTLQAMIDKAELSKYKCTWCKRNQASVADSGGAPYCRQCYGGEDYSTTSQMTTTDSTTMDLATDITSTTTDSQVNNLRNKIDQDKIKLKKDIEGLMMQFQPELATTLADFAMVENLYSSIAEYKGRIREWVQMVIAEYYAKIS